MRPQTDPLKLNSTPRAMTLRRDAVGRTHSRSPYGCLRHSAGRAAPNGSSAAPALTRAGCWNLAEHAATDGPQALQRLLRTTRWNKPALAAQMLLAALDAGVQATWASGDEVCGQDPRLRAALEERRMGYVLAIAGNRRVELEGVQVNTAEVATKYSWRTPARRPYRRTTNSRQAQLCQGQ